MMARTTTYNRDHDEDDDDAVVQKTIDARLTKRPTPFMKAAKRRAQGKYYDPRARRHVGRCSEQCRRGSRLTYKS